MRVPSLVHLSDEVLLRDLDALVARDRSTTAALLAHLGEVDDRRLYAAAGYPSMFTYCLEKLRFSEDVAYSRIYVARAARKTPSILEAIASGRLHLSAARLLAPYLNEDVAEELIAAASGLGRKSDIEIMLEARFRSAASEVGGPSPSKGSCESTSTPSREVWSLFPPQHVPEQVQTTLEIDDSTLDGGIGSTPQPRDAVGSSSPALARNPAARVGSSEPRFHLHLRLDRATHEKLQYAQALLSHAVPSGNVELVLDRALDALISKLLRRKFGISTRRPARVPAAAAEKPVSGSGRAPGGDATARDVGGAGRARTDARARRARRAIPARIRSAVWRRDGGRCTYIGVTGHRCRSRRLLEFDHVRPVARGGGETIEGLRLRCRAHNQYEAERTFGRAFMRMKREAARRGGEPIPAHTELRPGDRREDMRDENAEAPAP